MHNPQMTKPKPVFCDKVFGKFKPPTHKLKRVFCGRAQDVPKVA